MTHIPPVVETAILTARNSFVDGNRVWLEVKRKYDRLPFLRNPDNNAALITRDRRNAYITDMRRQIDAGYRVLVRVALANQLQAGGSSARWAQEQFEVILRDALTILPTWLMYVCEGKEVQADGWCGPRWLDMWPLGRSSFACETQWDKLTDQETKNAAERFYRFVSDSLNRHLMFIASRRILSEAIPQTELRQDGMVQDAQNYSPSSTQLHAPLSKPNRPTREQGVVATAARNDEIWAEYKRLVDSGQGARAAARAIAETQKFKRRGVPLSFDTIWNIVPHKRNPKK